MIGHVQTRLMLMLLQCGVALPFLHVRFVEAQSPRPEPVNVVVQLEGPAKVKRPGWTGYAPVVFGTGLQSGDLVSLDQGSHAKVVCSDLTLHDVPAGTGGVPCTSPGAVLHRADGSLIHATRGSPNDGSYPMVVLPRRTKLLSAHPTLRWTPVQGVSRYVIEIRGENLLWATEVTAGTQVVYPDTATPMKPGVDYKLIVAAGNGAISDEPGVGLGFSLLSPKDAKAVLQEEKQIESLGLPPGPTDFLIAHLYADHGLYAEAIERLEGISQKFKEAAVQKLLGDLFMDIGLPRQAEGRYLNALDLSATENDEEGQMLVHKALGYIYQQILGNNETASQQLGKALELARKLGDDSTASQAGKQLAEMKRAGT